ncbi:MAG: hypothetical protein KDD70_17715, partial [Bdellovibrionales bacterium]|nr:hypothetical protein [Bdellovibrionales bacterium]
KKSDIPNSDVLEIADALLSVHGTKKNHAAVVFALSKRPYSPELFDRVKRSAIASDEPVMEAVGQMNGVPASEIEEIVESELKRGFQHFIGALTAPNTPTVNVKELVVRHLNTLPHQGVHELLSWLESEKKPPKDPQELLKGLLESNATDETLLLVSRFLLHNVSDVSSHQILEAFQGRDYSPLIQAVMEDIVSSGKVSDANVVRELTALNAIPNVPDEEFAKMLSLYNVHGFSADVLVSTATVLSTRPYSRRLKPYWEKLFRESRSLAEVPIFEILAGTRGVSGHDLQQIGLTYLGRSNQIQKINGLTRVLMQREYDPDLLPLWHVLDNSQSAEDQKVAESLRHNTLIDADTPLVHTPKRIQRIGFALGALCRTPEGRRGLDYLQRAVHTEARADRYINDLVVEGADRGLSAGVIDEMIRHALVDGYQSGAEAGRYVDREMRVYPTSIMKIPEVRVPYWARDSRMVIVGDGPPAILMASLRYHLGYSPDATVIVGNAEKLGGIWRRSNVLAEGHNTFRSISAFNVGLEAVEPRAGADIERFLDSLIDRHDLEKLHRRGLAKGATYDSTSGKYVVSLKDYQGDEKQITADSLFIATGNNSPRSIKNGPMETNFGEIEGISMRRWQRSIPESTWQSYEGTTPFIVGLGNSAIAMIGEFQKMKDAGVDVRPVIITHHS